MRLLVTGDRNWANDQIIGAVLTSLARDYPDLVLIEGGANGADILSADIGRYLGIKVLEFKADWNRFGRGAGPIRNQQMLDEGKPTVVMAFHPSLKDSRGTLDMVKRARSANLPVTWLDDKGNSLTGSKLDDYLKTC
jgi:hypothetical protein